jgi:hypothetical protein
VVVLKFASFFVTPAKEDVIQLAFPKNGCSKSKDFPNLVEKSPGYVWNLRTKGYAKGIHHHYRVEQDFATVFSRANWITPSQAGVYPAMGTGRSLPSGRA